MTETERWNLYDALKAWRDRMGYYRPITYMQHAWIAGA